MDDYYVCECSSCRNLGNSVDVCCQCCACSNSPHANNGRGGGLSRPPDDESDDTESESDLRPESYQVSSVALTEDTLEVCLSETTPTPTQHAREAMLDQEDDYDDDEDDIAMAHRGPQMMARGPCVECHAHQQQLQQQQQQHANSCIPSNRPPTFSGWDGGHHPPRRPHPHEGEGHYHYPPTAQRHPHHPRGGMVRHHHPAGGHTHHRQHSHVARGNERDESPRKMDVALKLKKSPISGCACCACLPLAPKSFFFSSIVHDI